MRGSEKIKHMLRFCPPTTWNVEQQNIVFAKGKAKATASAPAKRKGRGKEGDGEMQCKKKRKTEDGARVVSRVSFEDGVGVRRGGERGRVRAKAVKSRTSQSKAERRAAKERARALEAMWSSGSDDDDGFGAGSDDEAEEVRRFLIILRGLCQL